MNELDVALGAAATLVAVAFALITWDRWLRRRRAHELMWTISLLLFAAGSAALWWGEARGWTAPSFRVFYLCGAILNVPWLAAGTVYLLTGVRWGDRVRTGLIFFSGLAAGVMLVAPLEGQVTPDELPAGKDVFGPWPRVLAAVGSGVAALVIIGGALWSAWRLWRHRAPAASGIARRVDRPARLVAGNLMIAAGTLVLSASGTFAGRLGKDRTFAVTLLSGIVILFAGFLVASAATATTRRSSTSRQVASQHLATEALG